MTNGCMASVFAASTPLVSAPSACPSRKTSGARFRRRTLSCRASAGDNDGLLWLPRRDMMLSGLSGVAAGLALYPGAASGADAATATETKCDMADRLSDKTVLCTDPSPGTAPCPLVSPADPVDFTPAARVTRFRKPVHLLSPEEKAKYTEAVRKMKALDVSDPTNPLRFAAQAAIHEAYCDAHYRYEETNKDKERPFDVHNSWLFAPWHRMYIYFYERALGDLIGDDTFALPYWSWDVPAGMVIPDIFKEEGTEGTNPLNDANRNTNNLDALVNLEYLSHRGDPLIPFNGPKDDKYKELVYNNLCSIYNQQFGLSADSYLGGKFCPEVPSPQGTLEAMAHTNMHVWVGKSLPQGAACTAENGVPSHIDNGKYNCSYDMGFLGAAGRDPLFYSHHSNVDRMWYLWQTRLGGGDGFPDPDWLDASFVFYDDVKNPRKVRIKFSDVLDTRNLGYTFDAKYDKDLPWMRVKTVSLVPHGKDAPAKSKAAAPSFPLALTKDKVVELPGLALPADKQPGKELLLVFDSVDYNPQAANRFDVAINVPADKAKKVGPQYKEYAGCFAVVPGTGSGTTKQTKVSLCINQVLFEIGADDDKTVDVVIVPRTHAKMTINTAPTIQYRK